MQLKTKKLKAKELPPCNTEPPITTCTHSQICTHLAKLTIKPTSLYVAECCVRYHSPESSWFLGIVNIFYTGTCRGKERQLSEWYLQESCQRVLEKQNALFKSTVYLLFFFFLHPLCLYVYRVSLECSHLEKQYLSFLVEEGFFFFFFPQVQSEHKDYFDDILGFCGRLLWISLIPVHSNFDLLRFFTSVLHRHHFPKVNRKIIVWSIRKHLCLDKHLLLHLQTD